MAVDTKSMRDLVDAAPGDRMAMQKSHLPAPIDATPGDRMAVEKNQIHSLLDAVDLGRVSSWLCIVSHSTGVGRASRPRPVLGLLPAAGSGMARYWPWRPRIVPGVVQNAMAARVRAPL